SYFVFFQAEAGIGDWSVTGVQTCALPICIVPGHEGFGRHKLLERANLKSHRSEEHTSELQSLTNLVCRLLLEKTEAHLLYTLSVGASSEQANARAIPHWP